MRQTAVVCGISMYPSLEDGDIIFYKKYLPNRTPLNKGDVVIFLHPLDNIKLIKRVSKIAKQGIEVSGDNKSFSKDSNTFGLIIKENILGIFSSKISRKINLSNRSSNKNRSTFL
tara:strand:+ start:911 stop:1255 length:345 start_codon:yes stop_codon:yes gene_type:complete